MPTVQNTFHILSTWLLSLCSVVLILVMKIFSIVPLNLYRKIQKLKQAHQTYKDRAAEWLGKSEHTVQQARLGGAIPIEFAALENYQSYVRIRLDQIDRRIIQGQTIPHEEKLFSIFQPHTEWICKGKAGVPVELGLRVCLMEDQHRFILHHQVMEKQTDDAIAVERVT